MSAPSLLSELEENISRLSLDEQLLLIERVSHRIRENISDKKELFKKPAKHLIHKFYFPTSV